jgi:rhodanese-related sulfurtransferase
MPRFDFKKSYFCKKTRVLFNKTTFFVLLLLIFGAAKAFPQVQNRAYRTMLKTLLKHSVPEISIEKAAQDSTAVFLDSREKKEFDVSHISGAIWVGYDDFDLDRVAQLAHNQRVIVYCSVGYRSEKVTEKLRAAGFLDVQNMYGGVFEWVNQGHKVVSEAGETEKVHAFDHVWGVWLRKGKRVY